MNPAIELAAYYRDHFRAFAFDCLHIALEAGGVGRLDFNPTQLELHRRLEQQRQLTGKVRAVVLKPRRALFPQDDFRRRHSHHHHHPP